MDIRDQIDYHQALLDRCTTLISSCDNKASFALAFVGVIIGAAISQISEEQVIVCSITEYTRCAIMILLTVSYILFLLTIMPQGKLKSKDNFLVDRMSSIVDGTTHLSKLKEQIKDSAYIYSRKCSYYKFGTLFLVISLVLIVLLEIFVIVKTAGKGKL